MMTIGIVELAKIFAENAHKGQVRKYTGEPYIGHPARVVGILQQYLPGSSAEVVAAAWLHDVVEDTTISLCDIGWNFGGTVAFLVDKLTKPNQPEGIIACVIKACDLIDNIGTIAAVAPAREARAYLAKKAPQVLLVCEKIQGYAPDLAEALAQAFWRNSENLDWFA
jgi:hypothetical protein